MTLVPSSAATERQIQSKITSVHSNTSHTMDDDSETTIPDEDDSSAESESEQQEEEEIKETPMRRGPTTATLQRKVGLVRKESTGPPVSPQPTKAPLKSSDDNEEGVSPRRRRAPVRTRSREMSIHDSKDAELAMAAMAAEQKSPHKQQAQNNNTAADGVSPRRQRRPPGRTRSREMSIHDSKDAEAALAAMAAEPPRRGRRGVARSRSLDPSIMDGNDLAMAALAATRLGTKASAGAVSNKQSEQEGKSPPRRRRAPNRTRSHELSIHDSHFADLALSAMNMPTINLEDDDDDHDKNNASATKATEAAAPRRGRRTVRRKSVDLMQNAWSADDQE
mmetsp:Transcript_11526/g.25759  ORF Transcript_11526/g.25759 Transcript_11526/m.25759 type:complete len:336 (+) Transcript_11526:145-1152(+)|eukprot:CAMPEP_0168722360 /NCGR_PEP_ID=MMETSP0724-20121128/2559_1 /TAXON_ID=265536 /ORGANISM="Amphiprora sp., Strain CCMP467" /LENGTH=335 /DNA_ID=CAMNT_0008769033 /DNA_START=107 /DNA_END=1114 /DNA_ORIENTATION=-